MDQVQGALIVGAGVFLCVFLMTRLPTGVKWAPAFINLNWSQSNFFGALFLGGAVLSIGTHGADQDMLLRVLATKNLREARKSLIFSGVGAAFLIALYLTVGYLLGLLRVADLDPRSPLADYVMKSNLALLKGVFLVLLLAAAMSTLDSTIHSTGAVWKSLMNSSLSGRYWSFLSLILITTAAVCFYSVSGRHENFLDLAMGCMNYINGGMIGIFTTFTFFPKRLKPAGIPLALVSGFVVTTVCEWAFSHPLPWTYTVLLSSGTALLCCLSASLLTQERPATPGLL
jgi:Na+/proline symporter